MAFTESDIQNIVGIQSGAAPVAPTPSAPVDTPAPAAGLPPTTSPPAEPPATTAPETTPAPAPGSSAPPPTPAAATPPVAEPPSDDMLDLTSLGFQDFDQLRDALNRVKDYERQLEELNEYKAGPKFRSDRQKLLYEFSNEVEGMELARARQLLEVVSLDLNNLPDQQVRLEAFKLKPENKDLPQDEIISLFKDEELGRYGNPQDTENPPTEPQRIRAKQATALAKQELAELQTKWKSARTAEPPSPQEVAMEAQRFRETIEMQTAGIDGIQLKLVAKGEKGETLESALSFKLDGQQKLKVINAMQDPNAWWDEKLEQFGVVAEGQAKANLQKMHELITRVEYHEKLINDAYAQGRADFQAEHLKAARNVADPSTTTAITPEPKPLNKVEEANKAAMKVVGLI